MSDLRVKFPRPCSEKWDGMRAEGCNRFCHRCEQTIHDLSRLTLDEAQALLAAGNKVCVRAKLNADGVVDTMTGRKGTTRRMIATVGASVGLLALSAQAAATDNKPLGAISGTVRVVEDRLLAIATGPDGREYRAKVKPNGNYRIKHLPSGPYRVRFAVHCNTGERGGWDGPVVAVGNVEASTGLIEPKDFVCPIIVGQLIIEDGSQHL